jgi:hypothetical protein
MISTVFRHKEIHKMTWSARGYRFIIDYILTNTKLPPLVNDTKIFRGYDVSTDHYLLISNVYLINGIYLLKDPHDKKKYLEYIC